MATLINVTLHLPLTNPANTVRKINDIKALREATRMITQARPAADVFGNRFGEGDCMGLTDAKNAIETLYERGFVTIRMTPERYGFFMVNRHDIAHDYGWQVKASSFYFEQERPHVFTI